MDQSRRAVESYWRSRMIDGATSDEDKVTPVYKLEEICDLLRSSHGSIVKEVAEFIIKRLEHKSPIVKQKALRVIKYAVVKSGVAFRRELQRNSVAVRQLIHYKGQPDPLKGDALNKAVRETAQEALSALFSSDDSKPAPTETTLGSRIQGFGSTNYEMPSEDKKSFISEVVDIGSSTIIQGLSNLTQSPSLRKHNDIGTYKSPNLRRSLTKESDYSHQYDGNGSSAETHSSSRFSNNASSGNWGKSTSSSNVETKNEDSSSTYGRISREEKLLETLVTSGGVRLQPTRDALHVFLVEASKVNALSLGHAIEAKLRSPMWQVRMKAICVLEAILRKKDDGHFSVIASYFSDNNDVVVQCSESPQGSLREKANKVLSLMSGEQNGVLNRIEPKMTPQSSVMPDLIDTVFSDDLLAAEHSAKIEIEPRDTNTAAPAALLIDDLLGDSFSFSQSTTEQKLDDDPFADVSFHTSQNKNHASDLFSGLDFDKSDVTENIAAHKSASDPFDFFNSSSEAAHENANSRKDVNDLMDGLSMNGNDPFMKQNGNTSMKGTENVDSTSSNIMNSGFVSQAAGVNINPMPPMGAVAYNFPPGLAFNPAFASQPMTYDTMGSLFAQQQFLASMHNFQQLRNLQPGTSVNTAGSVGGNALPDIFNPVMATQPPTSLMNDSRREETKAFDFISDHMVAARDSKRVV